MVMILPIFHLKKLINHHLVSKLRLLVVTIEIWHILVIVGIKSRIIYSQVKIV